MSVAVGLDVGTSGREGARASPRTARSSAAPSSSTRSRRRSRAGPSRTRRTGGARRRRRSSSCGARTSVAGIGLSGQMHGLVALDADEQVLRPAILWNDQRTARRVRGDRGADRARAADRADRQPRADRLHRAEAAVAARSTSRRSTSGSRTSCCRRTTCGCGCAASTRSTSPTRPGRCCSTSRTGAGATRCCEALDVDRGVAAARARVARGVGRDERRRPGRGGRRRPGRRRARRRRRRARASRCRSCSAPPASCSRRCPRSRADPEARVHAFCHAVPETWHAMGVMLSAAGSLRWLRDAIAAASDYRTSSTPRRRRGSRASRA